MTSRITSIEPSNTIVAFEQDKQPTLTLQLRSKQSCPKSLLVKQKLEAIAEKAVENAMSEQMQLKVFVWQEDILQEAAKIQEDKESIDLAHLLCFGLLDCDLSDQLQAEIMDILADVLPAGYTPALFVHEFKINFCAVVINERVDSAASAVVNKANTALCSMADSFDMTRRSIGVVNEAAQTSAGQALQKVEQVAAATTQLGVGLSGILKKMGQGK